MQTRRAQTPITIRSDRAASRLKLLTRDGRSQAQVIEEALEAMPLTESVAESPERATLSARIDAANAELSELKIPSMAEFDDKEYGECGNLR